MTTVGHVSVAEADGRYGWAVAADGKIWQGVLCSGSERVDAYLAAVEAVVTAEELQHRVVELLSPDPELVEALQALSFAFPLIEARHDPAPGYWARKARSVVRNSLLVPGEARTRVVAATDGSMRRVPNAVGRAPVGWGWVATDGRHAYGQCEADEILTVELLAVSRLLAGLHDASDLLVYVDSRAALTALRQLRADPAGGWLDRHSRMRQEVLRKLGRQLQGRDVQLKWVRGHSGHPLNEVADRLALNARRTADWGTDARVADEVASGILQDLVLSVAA